MRREALLAAFYSPVLGRYYCKLKLFISGQRPEENRHERGRSRQPYASYSGPKTT